MRLPADTRSRVAWMRLQLWRGGAGPEVELRLRPLGAAAVRARAGTSDAAVIMEDLIDGFYLPPAEVAERTLRRI